MFEFLNPRRVAARKLARLIAQKQLGRRVPSEEGKPAESVSAAREFDALESALSDELAKYGIQL